MNEEKLHWPILGCKVGQGDPTVMKLLTWCVALPTRCIYQVSNWYLKACWKKVQKTFRWLGVLLTPPSECFCPPEGQKLPNHDDNQKWSRHSLYKCVYLIWGLYIIFEATNAEKWLWPIFGCKVGQSVPIGMKLELDVWHYLLYVYTMFENDISKTCRKKAWKTSQNPKCAKKIAKIPKIRFLQKTELMSRSIWRAIYVQNLRNLPWFIRLRLQKLGLTYIWL